MTANRNPGNADADLIRYIDGELARDERVRLEAAMAADSELAARLAVLTRRSRRLTSLLAAADPSAQQIEAATRSITPEPTSSDGVVAIGDARSARRTRGAGTVARTRWLRAAVILLAIAGTAMIVPPVRAWIVGALQRLVTAPVAVPAPEPLTPGPAPQDGGLSVGIESVGSSFGITLDYPQTSGTLTLRIADVERVTARASAGATTESFLALTEALRIMNAESSAASYEIVLPANIRAVTVKIGSAPAVAVSMDGTSSRVIKLTGNEGSGV